MEKYNLLIDIDGTICEDVPNEEAHRFADAKLIDGAVERVNREYDEGHVITFFTSRTSEHREVTISYLDRSGFKYHGLITDKPRGNGMPYRWIDNLDVKGIKFNGAWSEVKI